MIAERSINELFTRSRDYFNTKTGEKLAAAVALVAIGGPGVVGYLYVSSDYFWRGSVTSTPATPESSIKIPDQSDYLTILKMGTETVLDCDANGNGYCYEPLRTPTVVIKYSPTMSVVEAVQR